ncbi:MAG: tetratricopeptide repeat-containing sensor histidine kinase [Bacteroidales bacterium]|nr:tetratricopeptide repeat-containing sensor histidine kinase [Bacteroidales bacterium]
MKKTLLILLLLLAAFSSYPENIDSLFNHFVFSKMSQRNNAAGELVYLFNKNECYDYPITYKHLGNNKMTEMLAYLGMANHEYNKANFLHAVHCAEKALLIVPEDSLLWRSSCYEILNVALQRMGDYSKALQYAKLDYETGIKLANEDIQSSALNSLAAILLATNHPEEALGYIQQAVDIERGNTEDQGKKLAIRLGIQCEVLAMLKRPNEALACINEALALDSAAQRFDKVAIRKSQKADVLLSMQQWEECRKICLESLETSRQNGNTVEKIITLKQLGACEIGLKHYDNAEKYLMEGERLCKETAFTPQLWRIQQQLFKLYKETGRWDKAVQYLELSCKTKDSLNNERFQQMMSDYRVVYETQAKDAQLAAQQKTMRVRQIWIIIFSISLALLTVSLILVFWLARIRKKNNIRLEEVNKTRNQIFSIVSHDLKNPVNAQKQMLDYMCQHFEQISESDKKEQINALKQSSDSLSKLLVNLLEWASLESGRLTYKPIRIDLNALINTSIRQVQTYADSKGINLLKNLQTNLFVWSDIKFMEIILRNLLHNAIKFSYEGGNVEINATKGNKKVTLTIVDHGVGMRPEDKMKIFKKELITTRGTSEETGTGIGLMICKSLIEKSDCELSFTSELGEGTTFTILLPQSE